MEPHVQQSGTHLPTFYVEMHQIQNLNEKVLLI